MSYNQHKRLALDPEAPLPHRASHLRSCAVHVSSRYRVHRSRVLELVQERTGIDASAPMTHDEIRRAMACLDELRNHWPQPRDHNEPPAGRRT